jgi:hypothetical protein
LICIAPGAAAFDIDTNMDAWVMAADTAGHTGRLYDRLSAMPVRIDYGQNAKPDAWRSDWPAVPPRAR